ncbi:MAG: hypothetical protein HYW05_02185 [Candidatus Diapherotrites archaeon]|nr:hypothetical protein [Candidatus Diapherotrites archaeon]
MRTINELGLLFSFDLLLAFFIMCAMLYFMLLNFNLIAAQDADALGEFSFYQNAFSFADSSVKDSFAVYDMERRRVLDNVIDYGLLKKSGSQKPENEKFLIGKIALEYVDGKKEVISESGNKNNCSAVERLVHIRNDSGDGKAKILFLMCGVGK